MHIDKNTGLPELPEKQAWRIFALEEKVLLSIVERRRRRRATGNVGVSGNLDPAEVLLADERRYHGEALIEVRDICVRTNRFPTHKTFWGTQKYEEDRTVSGTAVYHAESTLIASEAAIDATPEAVMEEAENLINSMVKRNAATKLSGLYPPNKMGAK